MSDEKDGDQPPARTGNVNVKDLVPCLALCCCICSCYTEIPDCIGSVCANTLLCFQNTVISCKTSKEAGILCRCCVLECDIVPFTTCCKTRSQIFCLDARASLPPSEEIPCMVTLCCLTLCYQYKCALGCGKEIRDIHRKANRKANSVSTEEEYECPWEEAYDPASKRKYYINFKTGVTQWERPKEMELEE